MVEFVKKMINLLKSKQFLHCKKKSKSNLKSLAELLMSAMFRTIFHSIFYSCKSAWHLEFYKLWKGFLLFSFKI